MKIQPRFKTNMSDVLEREITGGICPDAISTKILCAGQNLHFNILY